MAGYTYAEIRQRQRQYGMDHLSTAEFSEMMNQMSGSKAYNQGTSKFGNLFKAPSYGLDQLLQSSGAPQLAGDLGEFAFGQAGRHAFEGIPRVAVDLLPSVLAGPGGVIKSLATLAPTFAANTYEKTGSPGAAAVSALTTPLVPLGGKIGGGVANAITRPVRTEALAGSSLGLLRGQAAQQAVQTGAATQLAAGGAIQKFAPRALNYLGGKIGETFGLATQGGLVGAAAADKGQGWDAFSQSFSPENLAASGLSLLPFLAKDVAGRVINGRGAQAAEAKFLADYDNTLGKYNEARWAPQRDAVGELATNVNNRVTQLALPGSSPLASQFRLDQELIRGKQNIYDADQRNVTIGSVDEATLRPLKDDAGVAQHSVLRMPLKPSDQVAAEWAKVPDEGKLAIFTDALPAQKLESALLENSLPHGYRNTNTPESKAYMEQGGWKLHLTVKPENYKTVDDWLNANHKGQYKLLKGGDAGEKDFTVYVGDRNVADQLATKIEAELGGVLEKSNAGSSDTLFNSKVAGRFDVQNVKGATYKNTGRKGLPYDETGSLLMLQKLGAKTEAEKASIEKRLQEHEIRIEKDLTRQYGSRFSGNPVEAYRNEVRAEVEQLVNKGLSLDEAASEVAQREVTKATEKVTRRTKRQQLVDERNAWLQQWLPTAPPEIKAQIDAKFAQLKAKGGATDPTGILARSVQKWFQEGAVPEQLPKYLASGRRYAESRVRNDKTRTPMAQDGSPADGKGKKIHKYPDAASAEQQRSQWASEFPEFQWTKDPLKTGEYQILRYEWAETSGQGKKGGQDVVDEKAIEETAKEIEQANKDVVLAKPERPEHKAVVEEVRQQTQDNFLDSVPEEEWASLGDGDATLGENRFKAMMEAKGNAEQVMKSGLFKDKAEYGRFFVEAKQLYLDFIGEQRKAFGEGGQQDQIMPLSQLLKRVGLIDPAQLEEGIRLASLFANGEIAFGQLGKPNPEGGGLFTQSRDGQKAVWLAAGASPKKIAYILAHELNGHGLWALNAAGKLDAESSNRLNRYAAFVGENAPETNKIILREVAKMLPKELRNDPTFRDMIESTSHDPEEVLANINAAVSLAMVNAKPSAWKSFMEWMPKPIADFIGVAAKYGRKFFEAISGATYMKRQQGFDAKNEKELHDYIDTLYQVLKYDNKRTDLARDATRVDVAMTEGADLAASVGDFYNYPGSAEGEMISKAFGWGRSDESDPVRKSLYNKITGPVDRFMQPLLQFVYKHKALQQLGMLGPRREAQTNKMENDILANFGLHHDGVRIKADKASPVLEVAKNINLARARDTLIQRAQITKSVGKGKTVQENIDAKDEATLEVLKRLSPADQQLVRESILRQQDAQLQSAEMYKDQSLEKTIYQAGEVLHLKDTAMTGVQAKARAQQIVDDIVAGRPPQATTLADVAAIALAQKNIEHINKTYDVMVNDPGFITSRRFGDYKFRVDRKDGSHTVIDAKTLGEQTQKMAEWEAKRDTNGLLKITPLLLTKGQFDFNSSALEFLREREAGMRDTIVQTLEANGVDAVAAREMADRFSSAGDLARELASKKLPSVSVKRNFKEGWEELDSLDQQLTYMRMMIRGLTKGTADAAFNMFSRSPEVRDHPELPTVRRAWELYKTPDPKSVSLIQKANYYKYLAFHFLNMAQDAIYPWTGTLVPMMVDQGGGVVQSYNSVNKAAVRLIRKQLSPDEQAMIDDYRKGNRGIATYTDEGNNEILQYINARRVSEGKVPQTLGEIITKPIGALMIMSKAFHKKSTDFSAETSMLAAYEHFQRQGMSKADARDAAFDLVTTSTGGGKSGRPVGAWDSGNLKPLSASMMALQTFGLLQVGNWKLMAEKALGAMPELTKVQRQNAIKAFGAQSAMMFATAGIFGLPLVGAILAGIDELFGVNSKKAIADILQSDTSDDHTLQQIALHGLVNQFGGVDYASRGNVPNILGLNPREGWSLESLAGPTYGLIKDLFTSGQEAAKGELAQAGRELAPNNVKRVLEMWRDDWEFKRKDGTLVDESSPLENSVYSALGLKPTRIASMQERDQWQRIDAEIEKAERRSWLDEVVEELDSGDTQSVKELIQKRAVAKGEDATTIARAVAERVAEKNLPYDPRRLPGSSSRLNQTAGAQLPAYTEQQRLQLVSQILAGLGVGKPPSRSRWRQAAQVDQLRVGNPWLSYDEALDVINANSVGGLGGYSSRSLSLPGLGSLGGLGSL